MFPGCFGAIAKFWQKLPVMWGVTVLIEMPFNGIYISNMSFYVYDM